MSFLHNLLNVFLHLDKHLTEITTQYGVWTYAILFAIIFCETGLVVLPFLPGDSLLFAAGALGALGPLNPWILVISLCIAAILGDALNYAIGNYLGPRLKQQGKLPFIKQQHLDRTQKFYEKYGKSTIILARFVPIVRTFAPFLAGVGSMRYAEFAAYNVIGGIVWVNLFVWSGYLFGNMPVVKNNFGLVIIAIMVISVIPLIIEFIKFQRESKAEAAAKNKS